MKLKTAVQTYFSPANGPLTLIEQMVERELDEMPIKEDELYEQQNTLAADVNEIYLGYYALGGTWKGFMNAKEAEEAIKVRSSQLSPEVMEDQKERAKVMAVESLKWAAANGYEGSLQKAWWTARPGILAKAVGYEVDSRRNPTDTLFEFSDGSFLGISAKSTKGSGDIGFKNPGIGSLSKAIGVDLMSFVMKKEQDIIKKHGLPASTKERKLFIRANPKLREKTIKVGIEVLGTLRNALYDHFKKTFNKDTFEKHIKEMWLDASGADPYYIKVTGHGTAGNYTASIHDPVNNDKLKALSSEKISMTPVGNDSIGVSAGGAKIMKMRFKYESEKLASTIKLSGDPWAGAMKEEIALQEDTLQPQILDLGAKRRGELDESWLRMFGGAVETILGRMFGGGGGSPISIRGSRSEVDKFSQALQREKKYMQAYQKYGLDNPRVVKDRYQLQRAIDNFTRETGIAWPIK